MTTIEYAYPNRFQLSNPVGLTYLFATAMAKKAKGGKGVNVVNCGIV